ncbi:hypothetical protein B0H12DRAFT_1103572 [Mycena haematopus]|nr:hypothetical protein B0H12DRAFT_1103572 [Mycena haematopus]
MSSAEVMRRLDPTYLIYTAAFQLRYPRHLPSTISSPSSFGPTRSSLFFFLLMLGLRWILSQTLVRLAYSFGHSRNLSSPAPTSPLLCTPTQELQ